jgi:hypothetical protein
MFKCSWIRRGAAGAYKILFKLRQFIIWNKLLPAVLQKCKGYTYTVLLVETYKPLYVIINYLAEIFNMLPTTFLQLKTEIFDRNLHTADREQLSFAQM